VSDGGSHEVDGRRRGQGEVDRDAFFGTLRELNFDGVATACVFAWEERAEESSAFVLDRISKELSA
jgi:myo-inositol catabolism protein IolH